MHLLMHPRAVLCQLLPSMLVGIGLIFAVALGQCTQGQDGCAECDSSGQGCTKCDAGSGTPYLKKTNPSDPTGTCVSEAACQGSAGYYTDNSVPNAATCRSLELGVIRCVDEITEQVRRNTGLSVTDIQIERVLNGQSCSMDPAAKEIIVRQGRLYTEKILSAIMEAGFDLKAIPSVIMGGGASILKRHVAPQDGLCRQIYLTDVHANASGYERIVGQMCAK